MKTGEDTKRTMSTPGATSRLGALIALWLATQPKARGARSGVERALRSLLDQRWSPAEYRRALEEELSALERARHLTRGKRESFALTDAGRRTAAAAIGLDELPKKIGWKTLKRRYLVSSALGRKPQRKTLTARSCGDAKSLRAAILATHHRLDLGDCPTLRQTRDALAWRALGVETDKPLTLRAVLKLALGRTLGAGKEHEPDQAIEQLAAQAVGARRTGASELQTALLQRWLQGGEEPPDTAHPAAPPATTTAPAPALADDDPAFARRVIAAARASKTGRFGEDKVFISHVWQELTRDGAAPNDPGAFKARLVDAHFKALLSLSRADLVEAMEPDDVAASETQHDGATFHFVRL